MKKVSVILVALVLLLASMSLSAEGKWTNWGEGILYPVYSVDMDGANAGWGPIDWAEAGGETGIYNEFSFGYDGDNFGFSAVWGFDGKTVGNLTRFGAYYKMFDMLKLTIGAPRIGDYRFTTKIDGAGVTRFIDGAYGMAIQVTPIENLSVGAALYVPDLDPSAGGAAFLTKEKCFGAGASYALPDIATIGAIYNGDKNVVNASVNVTALKNVGIMAGYQLDWTLKDLAHKMYASLSAPVGPVNLALDGGFGIAADNTFAAELDANYVMGKFALGVTGGYDNGFGLIGSGEGTPGNGLVVFPYVKANFGDSYVKTGFIYAGGYDAHGGVAKAASVMAVPVMYVISF
jgi:hypothetical protein